MDDPSSWAWAGAWQPGSRAPRSTEVVAADVRRTESTSELGMGKGRTGTGDGSPTEASTIDVVWLRGSKPGRPCGHRPALAHPAPDDGEASVLRQRTRNKDAVLFPAANTGTMWSPNARRPAFDLKSHHRGLIEEGEEPSRRPAISVQPRKRFPFRRVRFLEGSENHPGLLPGEVPPAQTRPGEAPMSSSPRRG